MEMILLGHLLYIILTILVKVSGNEHFVLLENGRKYSWKEASEKCQRFGGTLPNWTSIPLSQETETQKLLNGNETWTSLQLVNGYIQEVTTHTSYTEFSNSLWEENRVWNTDSCVKLTAKQEFKAVKCSTHLPVVCQLQKIHTEGLHCNGVSPILTVQVSGKSLSVVHGELTIKESKQQDVSLHCKASKEMSEFDWIKDGVYINARSSIIYPAVTEDPSKVSNSYSTQGMYWCEAWVRGCAKKYHSNKINLTFDGIAVFHLNMKKEEIVVSDSANILTKLKTLIPTVPRGDIIDFDMRRGYTPIGKENISTYNFNIYIRSPAYDQGRTFLTNEVEFSSVSDVPIRRKRQSPPRNDCPKNFEVQGSYCYKITSEDTWRAALENCFQNGIEKSPIDVKNYWSNQQFINELINELNNKGATSIWLPAQRKTEGGPVYYSGPVVSDFNYNNHTATNDFNISWEEEYYDLKKKCVVLDIQTRILYMVSCDERFPFICLFPSQFWTQNITYDSFYDNDSNEDPPVFMLWTEARQTCKKHRNYDLISKDSTNYKGPDRKHTFIGRHNSALQRANQSQVYSEWINYLINNTDNLFHEFDSGFKSRHNNKNKTFVCAHGISHFDSILEIEQNPNKVNEFTVRTINTNEISLLYGVKCYLNGRKVNKDDKHSVFQINQEGSLFCEVLSHTPMKLIKSNVIHVQFPNVISFLCEILVGQKYNFSLHDLTFQSKDIGGVLYYEKLLNKKFPGYSISVLNVKGNLGISQINITFYIEMRLTNELSAEGNQISDFYKRINSLLQFNDRDWASKNVTVNYLKNSKYCMSQIQVLHETGGCKSNITWPNTLLNKIHECIECNKLHKRYCNGSLMGGAEWEPTVSVDIPDDVENIPLCNPEIIEKTTNLLTITSDLLHSTSTNKVNSITEFIHNFENVLYNSNVNLRNIQNSSVSVYSSKFEENVNGYVLRRTDRFKKIGSNTTFESDINIKDAITAVYFNFSGEKNVVTNTSVLITLFQNNTIFPLGTNNNLFRLSPVLLINISNLESLQFPIRILHSLENENTVNSSKLVCGYWNETTHQWEASEADKYDGKTESEQFFCSYYHLTCFTMLVHAVDEEHAAILEVFTQVGCYLSLVGLGLILIAFIVMRRWRDKTYDIKILFSLSLSLFFMYLLFLTGITQSSTEGLCIAFGASLHYFTLASFCWMLVVAYHNYMKFYVVIGRHISRFIMKASLSAWITPVIPIIIILSVNHRLYIYDKFCWIHSEGFYYGFLIPLGLIWLLNLIVFIMILYNVFNRQIKGSNVDRRSLMVSQVVLSLFLFVMLGLSWVFAFFATAQFSVVFSYLFCITSTTQGFLIFLFFVLLEKKAKDKWIKFIRPCFRPHEHVSSDSRSRKVSGTELVHVYSVAPHSREKHNDKF